MQSMKLREVKQPVFVEDANAFAGMLRQLKGCSVLAVDCEMDSFWSYWGRVCLVQLSDGESDWIVDPSAVDLSDLGPIMANPAIVKIFHDAEYDVRQVRRDFDYDFAGLFDTRAAAVGVGAHGRGLRDGCRAGAGLNRCSSRPMEGQQHRNDAQSAHGASLSVSQTWACH